MKPDAAIYNARLITICLKLLRDRYPQVSITDVLNHAGIEGYEISDEGHWITQEQIDRFYERIVQVTETRISLEAGVSPLPPEPSESCASMFSDCSARRKLLRFSTRRQKISLYPATIAPAR